MTGQEIVNALIGYGVPAGDAQILGAVAYGESGYQAGAVGDGGDSIGLFQINTPAHYDKLEGYTGSTSKFVWDMWLKNPDNNIKVAADVYKSQGLGAWTVYNTGAYKSFVNTYDDALVVSGVDAGVVVGGEASGAGIGAGVGLLLLVAFGALILSD